ncbi:MAG TPA: hypothetical protein VGM53_20370 [Streptosporangiaceae bacterium]|jgi:pimeloyl-ACP methyl ester carboxylesterase
MFADPVIVKAGGRDIAVEDTGPGTGFPVFVMNGAGSRHLFQPAVREGRDLGFRLIGYDRPGCGGSTGRAGRDAAHSRERAEYLAACERDVLRADGQGSFDDDGAWDDHCAFYHPWGFDLAGIRAPVSLWHGLKDFLPVTHARWLADRIPHVTTHFPADEDHTNVEDNNRGAAYAWLREKIAG